MIFSFRIPLSVVHLQAARHPTSAGLRTDALLHILNLVRGLAIQSARNVVASNLLLPMLRRYEHSYTVARRDIDLLALPWCEDDREILSKRHMSRPFFLLRIWIL
jgi:hypothetical protein